jgi:peptidoglycan DL-endopeptidase CwlO
MRSPVERAAGPQVTGVRWRPAFLAIALGLALGVAPASASAAPREPALPPSVGVRPVLGPVLAAGPPSALLVAERRRAAEVERLGEALSEHDMKLAAARAELAGRTQQLALAEQQLADEQQAAGEWARNAYIEARGVPDPLRALPHPATMPDGGLDLAADAVEAARNGYLAATANVQRTASARGAVNDKYMAEAQALAELRAGNAGTLAAAQAALDLRRQQAGDAFLADVGVPGGAAAPAALRAVAYALAQRGKPYVWGAEGPDTFDCSGLVQAAYASAGISLPRTARPQWRATPGVPTSQMIPGDLLFFATDASNWDSIHHVGIYLGNGRMIHAPQSGDVVRIAPVWWEEFFGATRVVPAVAGAQLPVTVPPKPAPQPGPKPAPAPKPPPSTPPTPPAPSTPPSPSTSTSPSASPSPSVSPSASPSGSSSQNPFTSLRPVIVIPLRERY